MTSPKSSEGHLGLRVCLKNETVWNMKRSCAYEGILKEVVVLFQKTLYPNHTLRIQNDTF